MYHLVVTVLEFQYKSKTVNLPIKYIALYAEGEKRLVMYGVPDEWTSTIDNDPEFRDANLAAIAADNTPPIFKSEEDMSIIARYNLIDVKSVKRFPRKVAG